MDISYDNYKLMKQIINLYGTTIEDFYMSKNQFLYSLEKINEYLRFNKYPEIALSENKIIVPKELVNSVDSIFNLNNNLILNAKDRISACELLIYCKDEPISLKDIMYIFDVSKNTAYNDIKTLSKELADNGLSISYTRKDGYCIKGSELYIRKRINYILEILHKDIGNTDIFKDICRIPNSQIEFSKNLIFEIEEKLQINFIEAKTVYYPYLLSIIIKRIENNFVLKENEQFFYELNDTSEFKIVSSIIDETYHLSILEQYYITLLILSISIAKFKIVSFEAKNKMSSVINEMISEFEKNACIKFSERDILLQNILQHMIAAWYRIKYDLTLSKEIIETIEANTNNLEFKLVEGIFDKSDKPLREFLETNIPDIEKKFLVLQFMACIKKQNLTPLTRQRAVVVCLNGVTISNLMYLSLREIFPELDFVDVTSLRDFYEINEDNYDIIFSTIDIKSNKKVFIVNPAVDFKNKDKLRKNIFEKLYGKSLTTNDLNAVYRIIDSTLSVEDANNLKANISKELHESKILNDQNELLSPNLNDLITPNRITIVNSVVDYKEAIRLAGKELLNEGIITSEYIEKIINNYNYDCPNIIFGDTIAVPHASAQDGSNSLAMSLLKINSGVDFGNKCFIHLIVMLAPIDTSSHLNALIQLSSLSINNHDLEEIINLSDKKKIMKIINKYSQIERIDNI